MVKYIVMLKRKPGITKHQFLQHWKEVHGPLVVRVSPGLKKYIQNHPLDVPGVEHEVDGIAELWFDTLEALQNWQAWRHTDSAAPLREDEDGLLDLNKVSRFIAQEHTVI